MEIQLNHVMKLSLTEIASRKVVINLWTEPDILSKIQLNLGCSFGLKNLFKEVEDIVKDKLLKLALPETLKRKMIYLIKPIGSEIRSWGKAHIRYLEDSDQEFNVLVLENIRWTTSGAINYRETAEELVHCEDVNILNRYKLACLYCLEDYIPGFWEELPKTTKSVFYRKNDVSHIKMPILQYLWPYLLQGEESTLNDAPSIFGFRPPVTFNQHVFEYAAKKGYKAATEYFFKKLSQEEREGTLVRTAGLVATLRNHEMLRCFSDFPFDTLSDVLCYLLSIMTPEQKLQVFKDSRSYVFRCFLDWPLQDLFLEVAAVIWPLPPNNYDTLLAYMCKTFICSGYYFPNLFQEFFIHSPLSFRKYFVHESRHFHDFFTIFAEHQDSETFKVVFRNVEVEDRLQLVFSFRFFNMLDNLLMGHHWHLVEVCIRETELSKQDKGRLKETYNGFLAEDYTLPEEWDRCFQLLDETSASSASKRNSEAIQTEAKKLCRKDS